MERKSSFRGLKATSSWPNSIVWATTFSPDGKELAALFNFDNGSHLIIWDMETGRPLVDAEYDQQISTFFRSDDAPVLTWAPDKSSILIAREYIMDAEPGKQVWKLPKADSNPVKMIRPFELLRVVRDSSNRKQTLATAQLPRREIDKIVAEVRSGGVAIDAGLPSLTTAELISAVPKSHPTSSPTWSV